MYSLDIRKEMTKKQKQNSIYEDVYQLIFRNGFPLVGVLRPPTLFKKNKKKTTSTLIQP